MNDVKDKYHMVFNDKQKLGKKKGEESNDSLPEGASVTFSRTAEWPRMSIPLYY